MDAERPFPIFKEVPHKADIALDVFAPNLPELFTNAALGLYHIMGVRKGTSDLKIFHLVLDDIDVEGLLVAFLSELLFRVEQGEAATKMNIMLHDEHFIAELEFASVLSLERAVKAITYHELHIEEDQNGYHTRIVFDL